MAEKIKGISGSIPSLTLFMDRRAGKRDGKSRGLFKEVSGHSGNIPVVEAYSAIPWIGKKIAYYRVYCSDLYQEAVGKLKPISENVAKEIRQHKQDMEMLEKTRGNKVSENKDVLIEALEKDIRALEENMSEEKKQVENIDTELESRIPGLGETLNVHVREYLQGVKRSMRDSSLPNFDSLQLGETKAEKAYKEQKKGILEELDGILQRRKVCDEKR